MTLPWPVFIHLENGNRVKLYKKIAALAVAVLSIGGVVAIAPEAVALPKTGIHTLHFDCHSTSPLHNSTTDVTYQLTQTGYLGGTNPVYTYSFELLSSTYHGTTPVNSRGPILTVESNGHRQGQGSASNLWQSAGFGGASNSSNYAWQYATATDGVTLTDGINVSWNPVTINVKPRSEGNPRFNFGQNLITPCSQTIDLGYPDSPESTLNQVVDVNCGDTYGSVRIKYDLTNPSGDTWALHVKEATLVNDPVIPGGATVTEWQVNVSGIPGGTQIADSGSAMWNHPQTTPGGAYNEVHGQNGIVFPTITFDVTPTTQADLNIVLRRDFATTTGPAVCDTHINLTRNWNQTFIGSDPAFEDISFDDCSSNPTVFKVKPSWQKTTDGKFYRLKSFQIFQSNSSGSKIVLDGGTATVLGGITVSENKFPTSNLVTLNTGTTLANRTITSGEWQTFDMDSAQLWTAVSAPGDHSTAPSSFYTSASAYPTVTVRAKVYNSVGALCTPSTSGGTGDISELEYQPLT